MTSNINWKSCLLFLLGFILINAYIPGVIGASIPTGWLFLLFTIPFVLFLYEIEITIIHVLGFILILYSTISLIWTTNFNIGFFIALQFIILCAVFCLGTALKDLRPIILGLALGLIPSDIISYFQYFNNDPVVFTLPGNVSALFVNKNIFCEVSVSILICLLAFKLWYFIPLTLPGIIMVHSRGAILGLFVGGIIWIYKQNKNAAYIISITALTTGLLYFYVYSNSISVFERFDLWADTIRGFKFFGNGIGSFEILYPLNAIYIDTGAARPRFAHNDLLHYIFEFGIGSIILMVLIYNVFKIKSEASVILYTIGTISMFSYPLHIPVTAFIGFLVAGYVSRGYISNGNISSICRPNIFKRSKGNRNNILQTS